MMAQAQQPSLLCGELASYLEHGGELVEVRFDQQSAAYHVHAIGPGRVAAWRCTFPRSLRGPAQDGQRYLVQRLSEAAGRRGEAGEAVPQGQPYYRTSGRIWIVQDGKPLEEVTPRPRRKDRQ